MISFLILGAHALIQNKRRTYIILMGIGASFHFSLLLTVPIIFLYGKLRQTKYFIAATYLSFLGSFGLSPVAIYKIASILGFKNIANKFQLYSNETFFQPNILLKILVIFILLHVFFLLYQYSNDYIFKELVCIAVLLFSIALLFAQFGIIINRLMLFTSILFPILFARGIHSFRRKNSYCIVLLFGTLVYLCVIFNHPSVTDQLLI